jgi:hypothetical protein
MPMFPRLGKSNTEENSMTQDSLNFDSTTFSAPLSQKAKKHGMDLASESRKFLLEAVRIAVMNIAQNRPSRTVCADDAQAWLVENGYKSTDLGNAAGSLFTGGRWEFVRYVHSTRVIGHGNLIREWRLK